MRKAHNGRHGNRMQVWAPVKNFGQADRSACPVFFYWRGAQPVVAAEPAIGMD